MKMNRHYAVMLLMLSGMLSALAMTASAQDLSAGDILIEMPEEDVEEGELLAEGDSARQEEKAGRTGEITGTAEVYGYSFEEIALIDNDTLLFTISCGDEDISDGYTWEAHLENRTDDYLTVKMEDVVIGDYMAAPVERETSSWAISAGGETDAQITWSPERLEQSGLQEISEIDFALRVGESVESFSVIYHLPAHSLSDGETEILFEQESEDGAQTAAEPEGIALELGTDLTGEIMSFDAGSEDDPEWKLLLENQGSFPVMVRINGAVLNGLYQTMAFEQVLLPGKKAVSLLDFWNLDYMENHIEGVSQADFAIQVWERRAEHSDQYDLRGTYPQSVYPQGEDNAYSQKREQAPEDVLLADEGGINIWLTGHDVSAVYGYESVELYLENQTKAGLSLTLGDESYAVTCSLPAGMARYKSVLAPLDLEEVVDGENLDAVLNVVVRDSSERKLMEEEYRVTTDQIAEIEEESEEEPAEAMEALTEEAQDDSDTGTPDDEAATESEDGAATEPDDGTSDEPDDETTEDGQTDEAADAQTDADGGEYYTDTLTVTNVQAALYQQGLDCGLVDGTLNERTVENILQFRKEQGLGDLDQIDRELLEALGTAPGDICAQVQTRLNEEGFDCGTPDGVIGSKTRQAIKDYKDAHGMEGGEADAKITGEFLEALGITW